MQALLKLSVTVLGIFLVGSSFARLENVEREDTVIFDIDDSTLANPENFNRLVPGTNRN